MLLAAARAGVQRAIVPAANSGEAVLVPGLTVRAIERLGDLINFARGTGALPTAVPVAECEEEPGPDLSDVVGQERGRFALELAAAGRHHLALLGPPGAGKTMLAQRLPSILPPLDDDAALEVTAVHSIAGALPPEARLVRRPPFQAPHHTATGPALVGGGTGLARPGALSLAHHGVLFLDEAPEFGPRVLNALRQPLEDGNVTLIRTQGSTVYPARIQLVLAANPCPCANSGDLSCDCSPLAKRRYLGRLSGPLMDRVDLRVRLNPVGAASLLTEPDEIEASSQVLKRVMAAREAAAERWSRLGLRLNADVPGKAMRCPPFRLPRRATEGLAQRLDRGAVSARGYDRVLRIAWTIVDLDGRSSPTRDDIEEAYQLRSGEAA
jgi:magnesium chelatase family protein